MTTLQVICKFSQTQARFRIWTEQLKVAAKRDDKMVWIADVPRPIESYAESIVFNAIYDYYLWLDGSTYFHSDLAHTMTDNLLRSLGVK